MNTKAKRDSLLLAMYCGVIFYLSHQPTLPVAMLFEHQDKLTHATAYGVMGCLAWLSFSHYITKPKILFVVSLFFCSFYGVSDEFHQSFVAGRNADVWDWLADTVGACLALLMMLKVSSKGSNRVSGL